MKSILHYRHHLSWRRVKPRSLNSTSASTIPATLRGRLTMNVAANAQLHHIGLAFENPQSHHFAHNDILLGQDAAACSHSFLLGRGTASQYQHAA